jgi:restriction system protein
MALWCCKGGRNGEYENGMLARGYVGKAGAKLGDLSKFGTREELTAHYRRHYPEASAHQAGNQVGQLWRLIYEMLRGDLVVLPRKDKSQIAVGEVDGPYKFLPDAGLHVRPVKWAKTDVPRTAFGQDLLRTFGSLLAISQASRNNAESRVQHVLEAGQDLEEPPAATEEEDEGPLDIEQAARDQIMGHISRRFAGSDLTRLVEAILNAQGMFTDRSSAAADGAVDLLAGSGAMGLDEPYMCVQVRAGQVDADLVRGLRTMMDRFRANRGLLVAWGGFTDAARRQAKDAFFAIRLWDAGDVVEALTKHYGNLDDAIQAELPLKRLWTLAADDHPEQ